MAKKKAVAKKSSSSNLFNVGWHFFIPALGALVITWIFSQDMTLSFEVGIVVVICSFVARYLGEKK